MNSIQSKGRSLRQPGRSTSTAAKSATARTIPIGPQTDYGNIYFKAPTEIGQPQSLEALAQALSESNGAGERVKIRNTGHSTNGQTLTSGRQIDLGGLSYAKYDPDRGTVTAGAGTSWADVLASTTFPAVCPPIFPNNPGQKIRVGGTASVGGVGPYVSSQGGFWNHVSGLKLVTMKGDIIECSRERNSELFHYSLAGFGRVGVIGEVTLDVAPSKPYIVALAFAYFDQTIFFEDFQKALVDPEFNGVFAQQDLSGIVAALLDATKTDLYLFIVLFEVDGQEDFIKKADAIKSRYREEVSVFLQAGAKVKGLDLSLTPVRVHKKDIVFYSPVDDVWWKSILKWFARLFGWKDEVMTNPWSDCIVDKQHYLAFIGEVKSLIVSLGMAEYLEKQTFIGDLIDMDTFVTFGIKNRNRPGENAFPLSLDLPQEPGHALGVAIMPIVPVQLKAEGLKLSKKVSDLVYEMQGRRYLYGTHDLSRAQVEQHYTRPVIEKWQALKDEHDPKHLLNIGVIEHLDT
jgi:FAD/FMN-containing dehydrogenase